ncbi:transcription elongation factor GreA [Halanaerobiaceae bacterium Z-7014]|uniref:Transcription elongation factor GreA n=1 Tax=Halonatronomonas betaini TaxID=2778430 RepID=A0A931F8V9_9FIRM|nr:transcription elongation factor GreA [Halonatronomonas betaini]MBF8438206.1 transcription elongation factor GreA [Halonatronomonas betaini]
MTEETLITEEGYENLEEELEHLIKIERREVAKRIKTARDFGDISENSEYDEAKNEQAFIEGRIKKIEKTLANARVIKKDEIDEHTVNLGTTVELKDLDNNKIFNYKIVGSAEADPLECKISNESPIGKAILGKSIDEEVEVQTPGGVTRYKILSIKIN